MQYYVNANASKHGNGSKEMPFKNINAAAQVAVAGDEVIVAKGIYREYVNPKYSGREGAPIIYRSEEKLGAVITGAEEIKGWNKYQDGVWVVRIPNGVFGNYNPYTTFVMGDWYFGPVNKHTGAVFLNNQALYEAESLEECIKGDVYPMSWEPEKSIYKWYTEQDKIQNETIIYANFQGKNPNDENVEINVRRECFMPSKTGISYITVSGFNINKAATTWAPPAAFQDGMIGPHWSRNWIIEDCEIWGSRCAGISLGKYEDVDNNHYFTYKHVKSPTQMERDAVCRGQYHGWLKENIGHHIVRRCHIHHCEQDGIVGRQGCVFSLIEDNHIHHINNMQELAGAEIAGIKLHAAIDVIIRRNHIHHSTMGIWCDWEAQGTRITQNLLHHNHQPKPLPTIPGAMMSQDIFVEVSHGPTLIDNNIMLSKVSLRMATEGIACVHNLMLGALTSVGSGVNFMAGDVVQPRYTPYHIPHRTEVAGFMTILHGDNRFYNNIFIQNTPVGDMAQDEREDMGMQMSDNEVAGTSVFDDYPTFEEWYEPFKKLEGKVAKEFDMMNLIEAHFGYLPIWASGNVYLKGAVAWKKEEDCLVDSSDDVNIEVIEDSNGHVSIKTNLYEKIGDYRSSIITTDTLGEAFEPEQRFENPDGTPIVFNMDYFGEHRGVIALAGPFANPEDINKVMW